MEKTLDFNSIKRHYLNIILNDEKKTKLQIMAPTKKLLDMVIEVLPKLDEAAPDEDELAALYNTAATAMKRNRKGIQVTPEELEEILDLEDLVNFYKSYVDWLTELAQSKN